MSDGPGTGQGTPHVVPQPQPYAPRRGPAAWVVVLLTLGAVGVVLLAFVGGVGVGFWAARGAAPAAAPDPVSPSDPLAPADPAQPAEPAEPADPDDPDDPDDPGVTGSLDTCLVGTWRTTSHEESYDTDDGQASLTGLDRTMVFEADGTQTITYDGSRATVTTEQGALPAVFDGSVVYRTTTVGGTMSFEVVESSGTVEVLGPDGEVAQTEPIEPGTGDVTYTCDEETFVQQATGYRSAYERVG